MRKIFFLWMPQLNFHLASDKSWIHRILIKKIKTIVEQKVKIESEKIYLILIHLRKKKTIRREFLNRWEIIIIRSLEEINSLFMSIRKFVNEPKAYNFSQSKVWSDIRQKVWRKFSAARTWCKQEKIIYNIRNLFPDSHTLKLEWERKEGGEKIVVIPNLIFATYWKLKYDLAWPLNYYFGYYEKHKKSTTARGTVECELENQHESSGLMCWKWIIESVGKLIIINIQMICTAKVMLW